MSARKPLATRQEVADYLGVPVSTMDYWALRKAGPKFTKVGRVARYDWADVERFLAQQQCGGAA